MAIYGISPVSFESVSNVTATPSVELGTKRWEGSSEYTYGYNGSAVSMWPGSQCHIAATTSGFTFTATNTAAGVGNICGVVHNATIPSGNYGWVVTRGITRARPDTNQVSWAAGIYLGVGVDNGFVSCPVTASTDIRWAYSIESGVTCEGATQASVGLARLLFCVW